MLVSLPNVRDWLTRSFQGFRLGSSIKTSKAARAEQEQAAASVNKTLLSIDYESASIILLMLRFC